MSDESKIAASLSTKEIPSLLSSLEQVAKTLAFVLALLYGLGLLVTNQHLMTLGVADFTAVRPKYILTGLWTALLLLAGSLPVIFFIGAVIETGPIEQMSRQKQQWRNVKLLQSLLAGLIAMLVFEYLILKAVGALYSFSVPQMLSMSWQLMLKMCSLVLLAFMVQTWVDEERAQRLRKGLKLIAFGCGTLLIISSLLITDKQINQIYINVPEGLGGAKPHAATIIFNEKGVAFWKKASDLQDNQPTAVFKNPNVDILFETEQVLVLTDSGWPPKKGVNRRIIVVKKALVDGVVHNKSE
jgi:hypothetical protein